LVAGLGGEKRDFPAGAGLFLPGSDLMFIGRMAGGVGFD
jgi:hypothetical protein